MEACFTRFTRFTWFNRIPRAKGRVVLELHSISLKRTDRPSKNCEGEDFVLLLYEALILWSSDVDWCRRCHTKRTASFDGPPPGSMAGAW